MYRLELNMDQPGTDEQGQPSLVIVQEELKLVQTFIQHFRRRGDKGGIAGATSANPILTATELAGLFAAAASLAEQDLVNLPDQAQTHWEAGTHSLQSVVHRRDVV